MRLVGDDNEVERRDQIVQIEANALEHAERLALRILDNPAHIGDAHACRLAIVVAQQTKLLHVLRRALVVEAGAG